MFKQEKVECTENEKGWLSVTDFEDGSAPAIEVYCHLDQTGNVCCPSKDGLKKIIDALTTAYEAME